MRKFLKSIVVMSFLGGVLLSVHSFASVPSALSDSFAEITGTDEAQALSTLGIHLYYAQSTVDTRLGDQLSTHIHSDPASLEDAAKLAHLLYNEFSNYPLECLRKSRFDKILITSGLSKTYSNETTPIRVNAAPIFGQNTMVYDVELLHGNWMDGDAYVLNVINHEYFHYLDFMDRNLGNDAAWMRVNAASPNGYGDGGDSVYLRGGIGYGEWNPSLVGYLDLYGESAMAEDKAEMFGALTAHPDRLAARTAADPILAQKASLLKDELQNYCTAFSSFWPIERDKEADRLAFTHSIRSAN